MINNISLVREFMPGGAKGPAEDGDQFLYTDVMDRTKKVGNNGVRIVKTFYHRSLSDFDTHSLQILDLCNALKVRAYTRLSPRSFKKVGAAFTRAVVEASLTDNWAGMKSLYQHACGVVTPSKKLWLWDVDVISPKTNIFENWLREGYLLQAVIPSRKGCHYISLPFDLRRWNPAQNPGSLSLLDVPEMGLHKDSPTNTFIPDGAA